MPIKGLEKGDGVWGRGKEPFLKKVFPSSPRLPYQPLSGTEPMCKCCGSYNRVGVLGKNGCQIIHIFNFTIGYDTA